jgi:hypothetical protein
MRRENSRYAIRASVTLALSLVALCGSPKPATAQNLEALAAGAAGLGAGVWWTMSIASARARSGTVLYEIDDIFSYALPVGAVSFGAGLALGLSEEERVGETLLGGAVGWGVGFAVGWVVGDAIWEDPAGPWAGSVIGAGVGLLAGSLTGFLLAETGSVEDESRSPLTLGFTLPLPW